MATIEPAKIPFGKPPYTVDDLLKFPDDGNRYELFNGSLLVSPAPTPPHQLAITNVLLILQRAAPPHLVTLTNVNLRVTDKDYYIPDVVVVPRSSVKTVGLMFTPRDMLLAVEVGSSSTRDRDEALKAFAYAKAGIPTYWRIEPEEGPTLYVYELNGGTYDTPTAYKAGAVADLKIPFPIRFDPAELDQ
ncbi:Uma2 family endonuclease [Nonomuraea sp. 10N515B]|uniref:Uma2 family endonuclease n=1 Tax=Nonomuraea sp. 10N515B TaxID=3457422 RepID=UPI003FCECC1E